MLLVFLYKYYVHDLYLFCDDFLLLLYIALIKIVSQSVMLVRSSIKLMNNNNKLLSCVEYSYDRVISTRTNVGVYY